jgi:GTP-binding protein
VILFADVLKLNVHPIIRELQSVPWRAKQRGIQLEAPLRMSLERAINYIDSDEYVEATPKSLRLRKRILSATTRKRAANLNYTICA